MNTGEIIKCLHPDGNTTNELVVWCDICGYSAIEDHRSEEQCFHFCIKHKNTELERRFLSGEIAGYFELDAQIEIIF
jgi:hypothetical protein